MEKVEIGIIGGSGLYSLLDNASKLKTATKYGDPSDAIEIGEIDGIKVAFLSRHGVGHRIPPHKVPYRANILALKNLGVKRIIATNAVGSLRPDFKPGEFVFIDQFVDMTHGRVDTFFDENIVAHISSADPYCSELRALGIKVAKGLKIKHHAKGTIVVINGPRFSTRAESKFFGSQGFDLIGMTQYPEVVLAREQGVCYLGISLVTDYDVGLEGRKDIKPVNADEVGAIFNKNVENVKKLIAKLVSEIPKDPSCNCGRSLDGAILSH
ncbi:MAG: S-methyl-5'-thioadenosine phosphorylase [Candidatus Micrarchaeaceae archaeon]